MAGAPGEGSRRTMKTPLTPTGFSLVSRAENPSTPVRVYRGNPGHADGITGAPPWRHR